MRLFDSVSVLGFAVASIAVLGALSMQLLQFAIGAATATTTMADNKNNNWKPQHPLAVVIHASSKKYMEKKKKREDNFLAFTLK